MATKAASRSVATAMAIAGRASRACDVCASKSARWYCGADAAYLCDRCDTQVHSANALALRHERVRLTPSGAPMKAPARKPVDATKSDEEDPQPRKRSISKIINTPAVPVLPCRKRSRTSRPHPHHRLAKQGVEPKASVIEDVKVKEELLTFSDIFDTEDFLVADDTHEVPSLITVGGELEQESSSPSSSELDYSSPESFSPDFHSDFHNVSSPSEDSFAAYFKGKAAQSQAQDDFADDVMSDQFLVPNVSFDNCLESEIDICCDVDGSVSLAGDACFIPGDIPGLDGFEDFGSQDLSDDYSLSFDLDLRSDSPETIQGDGDLGAETSLPTNAAGDATNQFATGPFAKFFATKPKTEKSPENLSPEIIKSEAKEILRCCLDGLSEADLRTVPSLRLNYADIINTWSDRGQPWVIPEHALNDVCLVPDMRLTDLDDDLTPGGREARVLRYKEKRRSRLFSKTIRYEVRKLNAERRPRMKGRFVKRTSNS